MSTCAQTVETHLRGKYRLKLRWIRFSRAFYFSLTSNVSPSKRFCVICSFSESHPHTICIWNEYPPTKGVKSCQQYLTLISSALNPILAQSVTFSPIQMVQEERSLDVQKACMVSLLSIYANIFLSLITLLCF